MPPSPNLSELERAWLKQTLDQAEHAMSYESARGAFAAFATMPVQPAPSCWLSLVLGGTLFENPDKEREVHDKLMRLCCEVRAYIEHATHAVCANPNDADAVGDWAYGYLSAAAIDDSFEDPPIAAVIAPLHMLHDPALTPERDRDETLRRMRAQLPYFVAVLYRHFRTAREASARGPIARSTPAQGAITTGRKGPCPCGSGKTFERCCAA